MIANERFLPDGTRQLEAYRLTKNKASGTETRVYPDGRQYIVGRNFEKFSAPGRLSLTQRNDGTREASLADGRPVYREQFQMIKDSAGQPQRALVRTVYMQVYRGRAVPLRTPVTQVYSVISFQGETMYGYVPTWRPDAYYVALSGPLPTAFSVATNCPDCMPADVVFESSFGLSGLFHLSASNADDAYSDPADLLGDMQAAQGYDDAMGGGGDDVSAGDGNIDASAPPADVAQAAVNPDDTSLHSQVSELQSQLDAAQGAASQPASEESDLVTTAAGNQSPSTAQATASSAKPEVPKHIRKQVRQQVKDAIALQKAHKPLSTADILASAQATNYSFRVASALIVEDATTQAKCVLHTNDYIKVAVVPQDTDKFVRMQVDTAAKNSCRSTSAVLVTRSSLQDMLNDFSQKLEHNMQVVTAAVAKSTPKQNSTSG